MVLKCIEGTLLYELDSNALHSRDLANKAVLAIIAMVAEKNPQWRYHQLLHNIQVTEPFDPDKFYEEPTTTLKRILENVYVKNFIVVANTKVEDTNAVKERTKED